MTHYDDDANRWGDDEEPEDVTCKHCGEDGLTWHHTGVRWALIDDEGNLHSCDFTTEFESFS